MENGQDYNGPKEKKQRFLSHISTPDFFESHGTISRVKWSVQLLNPYSLGFRSGDETIDAIATLIHMSALITALRKGYKSRSTTIFIDLEKSFDLVSKEVLLESAALLCSQGQLLMWLVDYF